MKNHKRIGTFVFFVLSIESAGAQQIHQAIASGGGNAFGATGSVSYTIGQMVYTTTSGASGTSAEGIQTTVNLGNPLPVTLISFGAECVGGGVQLKWYTSGIDKDFFVVEKSADASVWTPMTTLPGEKGSDNYSCTDRQPALPVSYYRLKQVDKQGNATYSTVIQAAGCGSPEKAVTLYPNPTATGVYLATTEVGDRKYELYDTRGVLLRTDRLQKGTAYIDMSAWAAGTYFLKLRQNDTILQSFSIIKN